jgi:hypothetical protein
MWLLLLVELSTLVLNNAANTLEALFKQFQETLRKMRLPQRFRRTTKSSVMLRTTLSTGKNSYHSTRRDIAEYLNM